MAEKTTPASPASPGERIAKVLSRAGVASRREAERLIELGEVTVNGQVIVSPALNVTAADRIAVRGEPVRPPEPARLWLYYKPEGLVTSAADEKGRPTVFEAMPEEMPRVMSVGRLDLNSEGLLLLTNDGALKRRLELPSTGWLRKYRVRIKGNPADPDLEPLRRGIEIDGERFQPMTVTLDRIQGANAWLTVGLREGRNREIRRALASIGLTVNRLIRTSYGPFRLGEMQPGDIEEVRPKVLRDQLGLGPAEDDAETPRHARRPRTAGPASDRAARKPKPGKTERAEAGAGRSASAKVAPGTDRPRKARPDTELQDASPTGSARGRTAAKTGPAVSPRLRAGEKAGLASDAAPRPAGAGPRRPKGGKPGGKGGPGRRNGPRAG